MTFSINVPNAAESPGLFPAQANTNFSRLKLLISGDHQFNDTLADTDGFHNRISYINRPAVPAIPTGANAIGYSLNVTLGSLVNRTEVFVRNAQTNMLIGTRAYATFTGRGTNGLCVIQSSFNITQVNRVNPGIYEFTMTNPMATNTYAIFSFASELYLPTYLHIPGKTTTTFTVRFRDIGGNQPLGDPAVANVMVYGG